MKQNTSIAEWHFSIIKILIFIFVLLQIIFIFFIDVRKILITIPDDASYFFTIAENAANGKGFSFDGINPTNGYQPLWLLFLIAVNFVFSFSPEMNCRLYLFIQVAFLILSSLLLFKTVRAFTTRLNTWLVTLFFYLFVFLQSVNGMETALLVLMQSIIFFFGWKIRIFQNYQALKNFISGNLLGLLFLARLDMIFLIASFVIVFTTTQSSTERLWTKNIKKTFTILIGSSTFIIPYLLYNLLEFGSIQPISGALKSSFPQMNLNLVFSFTILNYITVFAAVFISIIYLVWFLIKIYLRQITELSYIKTFNGVLSISILLHFSYYIFFTTWEHINWHYTFYGIFLSLVLIDLIDFLLKNSSLINKRIFFISISGMVFIFLFGKTFTRFNYDINRTWHGIAYDAAVWARTNSNANDVFAMSDAGNFAYFSKRKIINLDGLVNNFDYQKIIREKKLKNYLSVNKVKYFVQVNIGSNEEIVNSNYSKHTLKFISYLYSVESDPVTLRLEDEVYHQNYFIDGNRTSFIIWKYNDKMNL